MSKLFLVSSVSASGKTTLVNSVIQNYNLYRIKTCTTRPKRPEEIGDEYYFITQEEFNQRIVEESFIEHAYVYGNSYGIEKSEFENNKHKNCIVITDIQGKNNLVAIYPQIFTIFIMPPSESVVLERLQSRNTNEKDVHTRMQHFHEEMSHADEFHFKIPNGDLEMMTNFMNSIVSFMVHA